MGQEHSLIQAPIGDEISEGGPRQAGCVCSGMIGVHSAGKAYDNHQDHLKAQDLSEKDRERLVDEAWETLTGEKN